MNAAGMTTRACQEAMDNVGGGIGASLRAVDCAAGQMAQSMFGRLGEVLGPSFTILLTLFIAIFAFALITGRTQISLSSLTPRMFTLVGVITFATSWIAFQSFFYNLLALGPEWLGSQLMRTDGSATNVFADKIDVVLGVLVEASGGDAMEVATSVFSPPGLMWLGGTLLLLGTVGILATCKIALAVLMALGPVFIVMALFEGTRGLFVGWLKGLTMLAIAPLFAVLGGSLMLELAVPVIAQLSQIPGEIDARAAMAFFMIGAVHCALMVMVLKVAATMVAGWTVFGLARSAREDERGAATLAASPRARAAAAYQAAAATPGRVDPIARAATPAPGREIRVAGAAMPMAANDTGGASATREIRTTRIVGPGASNGSETDRPQISRARGIGSRFKSAPPIPAARPMENKS